jgi:hypothetical protein
MDQHVWAFLLGRPAVHSTDRQFIRAYKSWLNSVTTLDDCLYRSSSESSEKSFNGFTDHELSALRNRPSEAYVERYCGGLRFPVKLYRNAFTPTYADFATHLTPDSDFTIYARNRSSSDSVILMLADVDNKQATGEPFNAVDSFLASEGISAYVEPSTLLNGCHAYFLLDTKITGADFYGGRRDVWRWMQAWSEQIKSLSIWQDHGVNWDGFYGLPTCWTKTKAKYEMEARGNALKLPRLADGLSDLSKLKTLKPIRLEAVMERIGGRVLPLTASGSSSQLKRIVNTDAINVLDGWTKKKKCVSRCLIQTDGAATLQDVYYDYMTNYSPSTEGDTPADTKKRRNDLRTCLTKMKRKFRPKSDIRKYPFLRDQFLSVIKDLKIPDSEFNWTRREKLNHQRLSDFISLKIADAVYVGRAFGSTSRDMTISNSRALKEKGMIDWIVAPNVYTKLLAIAVKYKLLEVVEDYERPIRDAGTGRKLTNGMARVIGPGEALPQIKAEWRTMYAAARMSMKVKMAA